jgi:hypothetical protein
MAKTLILLSGKKRHGKDTVATMLKALDPSIKLMSFAAPLKQIIADTFAIPAPELEQWKNDGYLVLHGIPPTDTADAEFQAQSYREILQRFGTEAMKPIFGDDVWVQLASRTILNHFKITNTVVLTDWRFPIEFEELTKILADKDIEIVTLRVNRQGIDSDDSHPSETALDNFSFSTVIANDGTLDDLNTIITSWYGTS